MKLRVHIILVEIFFVFNEVSFCIKHYDKFKSLSYLFYIAEGLRR